MKRFICVFFALVMLLGSASAAFTGKESDTAPAVKISADGKTATATNYDRLYVRVAVVFEHDGSTGLCVTQADIDRDGRIEIPGPDNPKDEVKAVCVALVPTYRDIMSRTPDCKAVDYIIL